MSLVPSSGCCLTSLKASVWPCPPSSSYNSSSTARTNLGYDLPNTVKYFFIIDLSVKKKCPTRAVEGTGCCQASCFSSPSGTTPYHSEPCTWDTSSHSHLILQDLPVPCQQGCLPEVVESLRNLKLKEDQLFQQQIIHITSVKKTSLEHTNSWGLKNFKQNLVHSPKFSLMTWFAQPSKTKIKQILKITLWFENIN